MMVKMAGLTTPRPTTTPGLRQKDENGQDALDAEGHQLFRQLVGKLQWIVPLRPDIAFATKELARKLTGPTVNDWTSLKQVLRYLSGTTHYVYVLRPEVRLTDGVKNFVDVNVFTDSDWAGCRVIGKSTSGCMLMRGDHFIKSWSRTQQFVTLSSTEARLVAMTKLIAEMIGLRHMSHEWGQPVIAKVFADRKGSGKLRHIYVGLLWV